MTADARIEPIHGHNLSDAWAQAFLKCYNASGSAISPGIVSFDVGNGEKWVWFCAKPILWVLHSCHLQAEYTRQSSRWGLGCWYWSCKKVQILRPTDFCDAGGRSDGLRELLE